MIESRENEYRKTVKYRYDFSSWVGTTRGPESALYVNFLFPFRELNGLTLEKKKELPRYPNVRNTFRYIFSSTEVPNDIRLVIRVAECNSITEAHEALIDSVMTSMAPILPRCESLGIDIGDICFGGFGEQQTSIIFTRYNILVDVRSAGFQDLKVDEIAGKIDSFIYCDPKETEGYKEFKPIISRFRISRKTIKVDKEIVVRVEVLDPNNRKVMTKIVGTGGKLLKKGDKYIYHAEKQGKQSIRIFAINEDGYITRSERWLTVK